MKKKRPKLPSNSKRGDVLRVIWEDHFSASGWKDADASLNHAPCKIESVGFYIGFNEKAKGLVIALNHMLGGPDVSETMCILADQITSIKRIARAT